MEEQWGPWIEWNGGECPIPHAGPGEWGAMYKGGGISGLPAIEPAKSFPMAWSERLGSVRFAAYRVRLDAVAVGATTGQGICCDPGWHDWHEGDTVPSVDRVDVIRITAGIKGTSEHQIDNVVTTSQYWGPNSFVRKWRPAVVHPVLADPNAKMVSRDGSMSYGRAKWSDMGSPLWVSVDLAATECHGALTCAPMAYRLGLGRAF